MRHILDFLVIGTHLQKLEFPPTRNGICKGTEGLGMFAVSGRLHGLVTQLPGW